MTTETSKPRASEWTGSRDARRIAGWREVQERLHKGDATILDTRSDSEYLGAQVRAARGGAIPGAVHIEWTRNLGRTALSGRQASFARSTSMAVSPPTEKSSHIARVDIAQRTATWRCG